MIFGVSFFICLQAQTQGFQEYFIKTILGTSGAIVITDRFQNRYTSFANTTGSTVMGGQQRRKYYEGITDAAEIMRVARQFPNVLACAPVVQGNVTIRGDFQTEVVTLNGIDLDLQLRRDGVARADHRGRHQQVPRQPVRVDPRLAAGRQDAGQDRRQRHPSG